MNGLILKDHCTVWKKSEVSRVATWSPIFASCQWEPTIGETRSPSGNTASNGVSVILKEDFLKLGDVVTYGLSTDMEPSGFYTVVSLDRVYIRGRYHHTEVMAR